MPKLSLHFHSWGQLRLGVGMEGKEQRAHLTAEDG